MITCTLTPRLAALTRALTIAVSLMTPRIKSDADLSGLVYGAGPVAPARGPAWLAPGLLGSLILIAVLLLNILFW